MNPCITTVRTDRTPIQTKGNVPINVFALKLRNKPYSNPTTESTAESTVQTNLIKIYLLYVVGNIRNKYSSPRRK